MAAMIVLQLDLYDFENPLDRLWDDVDHTSDIRVSDLEAHFLEDFVWRWGLIDDVKLGVLLLRVFQL